MASPRRWPSKLLMLVTDRKRCAELMGCIRGELTLNVEALLEAVQRAIDRAHQGGDLTW